MLKNITQSNSFCKIKYQNNAKKMTLATCRKTAPHTTGHFKHLPGRRICNGQIYLAGAPFFHATAK
jgi:hypothetical protein